MFIYYSKNRHQGKILHCGIFLKSVILFLSAYLLASPLLFGVGNIAPGNSMHIVFLENNILSKCGQKRAKALTSFALAYNKIKKSGKFSDKSITLLLDALKEDPYAIPPLKLLIINWKRRGLLQKIIENLYPLAKKHPDALRLNFITAQTLKQLKRKKEARALLEASLDYLDYQTSKNVNAYDLGELISILSATYIKTGDKDKCEDMWDNALENDVIAKQLIVRIAAINFYAQFADQGEDGFFAGWSKRRYRRKLEKNIAVFEHLWDESNLQNALLLASVLRVFKRYKLEKKCEQILLKMLAKNPYNSSAMLVLAQSYSDYNRYADATRAWQTIIDSNHYRQVGDIWKLITHNRGDEGDFYLELASVALKDKNYKEAIRAFDWYLLLNPDDSEIIFRLGYAYMKLHNDTVAILKFEEALDIPEANFYRAKCYMNEGRYNKALTAIKLAESSALNFNHKTILNDNFYIEYALIADKAGSYKKTNTLLKKLLKKHPNDPMLNNFMGYFWAERGINLKKAIVLIKKAFDSDRQSSAYLDSLAWAYYKSKMFKEAKKQIKKALNIEGDLPNAVIADHAGDIFYKNGEIKKAIKYWEIALMVYSEDIDRKLLMNKIDKARNSQFEKL